MAAGDGVSSDRGAARSATWSSVCVGKAATGVICAAFAAGDGTRSTIGCKASPEDNSGSNALVSVGEGDAGGLSSGSLAARDISSSIRVVVLARAGPAGGLTRSAARSPERWTSALCSAVPSGRASHPVTIAAAAATSTETAPYPRCELSSRTLPPLACLARIAPRPRRKIGDYAAFRQAVAMLRRHSRWVDSGQGARRPYSSIPASLAKS